MEHKARTNLLEKLKTKDKYPSLNAISIVIYYECSNCDGSGKIKVLEHPDGLSDCIFCENGIIKEKFKLIDLLINYKDEIQEILGIKNSIADDALFALGLHNANFDSDEAIQSNGNKHPRPIDINDDNLAKEEIKNIFKSMSGLGIGVKQNGDNE